MDINAGENTIDPENSMSDSTATVTTYNDNAVLMTEISSVVQLYDIPTSVNSALVEAFQENDFIKDDDTYTIYFKEDIDLFEKDVSEGRVIYIMLDSDKSSGDIVSRYTYFGKITSANSFTEDIRLYKKPAHFGDDPEKITTISDITPTDFCHLENKEDWAICVMVEQQFNEGKYAETPRLYIYVPKSKKEVDAKKLDKSDSKEDNSDDQKKPVINQSILDAITKFNS
jgi:hypothetical protein